MRILFISGCAPAKYNYREPNSYPFYLIKEMASAHETGVLYFNSNKKIAVTEINKGLREAGVIWQEEVKAHRAMKTIFSLLYIPKAVILKLLVWAGLRPPAFLVPLQLSVYKKYPAASFGHRIKEFAPDLVIVFPMQLYFAVKKIGKLKIPVSILCTDSARLHFARQLKVVDRIPASRLVTKQMLEQTGKLERRYKRITAKYFFVGEKDMESFCEKNGQADHSFFIPHHLYTSHPANKKWNNTTPRINILFGGDGHTIYVGDETDRIAKQIVQNKMIGPDTVNFYFLGTSYDQAIDTLRQGGYTVISQAWADDYNTYLENIHVQVFPIILGTGTKAKVLEAMTAGLLCIGTRFAFENIRATEEDYLLYEKPEDVPSIIAGICEDKSRFERIAVQTRDKIFFEHNTPKVVQLILSLSSR